MQAAISALIIVSALLLALWPLACLLVAIRHGMRQQWGRLGQLGLLVPLWTIAATVVVLLLAPFLTAPDVERSLPSPFWATLGLGFVLFCGGAAWGLLFATLGPPPPPDATPSGHAR